MTAIIDTRDLSGLIKAFANQVQKPNTPQDHLNLANRAFLTATLRYISAGKLDNAQATLALIEQATVGDLGVEFQIACTKRLLMTYATDKRVAARGQRELAQLKALLDEVAAPAWTATWLPALEALAEAKRCGKEA